MPQSFCICVTIVNNPIVIFLSQQAVPLNNTRSKLTVSVRRLFSPLKNLIVSKHRQRAETPEKETGNKKDKIILCPFFV